jgi:hypothetical protein
MKLLKQIRIVDETRLLVGHIPYVIIDKFCYKHQRQMFNLMHIWRKGNELKAWCSISSLDMSN